MKISQFDVCEKFCMSRMPDVSPQNKCFAKVGIYNPGQYFCIIFANSTEFDNFMLYVLLLILANRERHTTVIISSSIFRKPHNVQK